MVAKDAQMTDLDMPFVRNPTEVEYVCHMRDNLPKDISSGSDVVVSS